MIEKITIYDVKTGETRIEEIEVEDVIEELEPIQLPTIEERLLKLENADIDIIATNWDMDFRICEIEWLLEDNIMSVSEDNIMPVSIDTFNLKGGDSMSLSRYEQAKIMILGGVYNDTTLRKQLKTYLDKRYLTQEEYNELISLMDARELVENK